MDTEERKALDKLQLEQWEQNLFRIPEFDRIRIPPNPLVEHAKDNYASEFHDRLSSWIRTFDQGLDENHEVGIRLVSFGQTVTFHLTDIGFWNPSLISFNGFGENGEPVELIQHVSQISILLTKLPRLHLDHNKVPFGFHAMKKDQTEQ